MHRLFGVDRGQVFGVVAARTTISASSSAAAAVLLSLCGLLSSQAQKNTKTGFVRNRKLVQPCRLGKY